MKGVGYNPISERKREGKKMLLWDFFISFTSDERAKVAAKKSERGLADGADGAAQQPTLLPSLSFSKGVS